MARKDRVPNPPKRPVQAPRRRSTPATASDAERQKRLLYILAASGIAALVVVLGVLFLGGGGGGGDDNERAVLEEAGCTLQSFPAQANASDHSDVPTLQTKPKWNSLPPTSGPHFGQTAIFGSYDEPVPLVQSTHNLEHGAVIIHYGDDVPEPEIEAIRSFYEDDPNGLIVAPLPQLGEKIALTAWTAPEPTPGGIPDRGRGYLAECTEFDETAFSTFVDEHRGNGPERFPVDALEPGGP